MFYCQCIVNVRCFTLQGWSQGKTDTTSGLKDLACMHDINHVQCFIVRVPCFTLQGGLKSNINITS